jgi:hypothetical protein
LVFHHPKIITSAFNDIRIRSFSIHIPHINEHQKHAGFKAEMSIAAENLPLPGRAATNSGSCRSAMHY